MKKPFLSLISLLWVFSTYSQEIKETAFTSQIQDVTVFLAGAQVFEKAQGQLSAGESFILVKGLSPYIDEKSIQIKGQGNFTIQAVNKRLDFLSAKAFNEKVKALNDQILEIQRNRSLETARLQILEEKASLLQANKKLGGEQSGPSIAELRSALDFYETELTKLKTEELQIQAKMQQENEEMDRLFNQIRAMQESDNKSTSEIRIRVKAPVAGSANLEINYLVANAGWYPKYDVRVKNVSSPLSLNYKAEVYQNTGVDWKNVKLRFSNANPNQSGQAPNLEKWELNYARFTIPKTYMGPSVPGTVSGIVIEEMSGEPMPGVTVVVKGSTIGTVTDSEGRYSLSLSQNAQTLVFSFIGMRVEEKAINNQSTVNAVLIDDDQMLQESIEVNFDVQVKQSLQGRVAGVNSKSNTREMEAAPLVTTFVENQTTVEIEVAEPYSIKSNGEKTLVDLKAYDIPANYRYSAIPKLDKDAFLIAEISDWNQYSLLEGESNLYFEDGFVGRSILNAAGLQDTLLISMGRDRSIVVQREKMEEFSKKRTLGSNITETRGYEITLRNNKSQPVTMKVDDQIPVSVNSTITVEAIELSSGKLNPQTGNVTWEITLAPGAQQKISLQYEVKYPKSERVILD
jgi:hypothetical protein